MLLTSGLLRVQLVVLRNMPVTRSSTRNTPQVISPVESKKRKKGSNKNADTKDIQKHPRINKITDSSLSACIAPQAGPTNSSTSQNSSGLVPAVLTFSFDDAKEHLTGVDHRFKDLFNKMECKPFQQLERVHPFR